MSRQSAGRFSFNSKATGRIDNTYNKYINLPLISKNVSKHNSNLTDSNFGYFLAGLIVSFPYPNKGMGIKPVGTLSNALHCGHPA